MRKFIRGLYTRYVPKATRDKIAVYAKGAVAGSGGFLSAVNLLFPAYGDQAQAIVGTAIAAATWLGVVKVRNRRAR